MPGSSLMPAQVPCSKFKGKTACRVVAVSCGRVNCEAQTHGEISPMYPLPANPIRLIFITLASLVGFVAEVDAQRMATRRPKSGDAAQKGPRIGPVVAIWVNPFGDASLEVKPRSKRLKHWQADLRNAAEAHAKVGHPVSIFYQGGDDELSREVDGVMTACRSEGAAVEGVAFDNGIDAENKMGSWLGGHIAPQEGRTPTPFAFLVVIGHGDTSNQTDRCVLCAEGVFNVSAFERSCSDARFPLISVLHICSQENSDVAVERELAIDVPTIPVGASIERFVVEGSAYGGALPVSWTERDGKSTRDNVCRICSAPAGRLAIDDGQFFQAYRDSFSLSRVNAKLFVHNRDAEGPERQNLRLMHLRDRMALAGTLANRAGRQSGYDVCSTPSSITPWHIIATTDPQYVFVAPAASILGRFDPNLNAPEGLFDGISFETARLDGRVAVFGNGRNLVKPYAAVNVPDLFTDKTPLFGKVLYVEVASRRPMNLAFMRNDPTQPNTTQRLTAIDLTANPPAKIPSGVCQVTNRIKAYTIAPPAGFFVERDRVLGLSLSPVDRAGQSNNAGWTIFDRIELGPLLMVDSLDRGESIGNWKRWEQSSLSISLKERWVPQRWWRSDESANLSYSLADTAKKKAGEFVVEGEAWVGVGGPLVFQPEIIVSPASVEGRNHGLDVRILYSRKAAKPAEVATVVLMENSRIVGTLPLTGKELRGVAKGFLPLPPGIAVNYLAVVLHGSGTASIQELQLGWAPLRR